MAEQLDVVSKRLRGVAEQLNFVSRQLNIFTQQIPVCYLLNLPPELRLRIYDFVFTTDNDSELEFQVDFFIGRPLVHYLSAAQNQYYPRHAALLRTCKLIYKGAWPIFCSKIYVEVFMDDDTYMFDVCEYIPLGTMENCRVFKYTEVMWLHCSMRQRSSDKGSLTKSHYAETMENFVKLAGSARSGGLGSVGVHFWYEEDSSNNFGCAEDVAMFCRSLVGIQSATPPIITMDEKWSDSVRGLVESMEFVFEPFSPYD